jgi:hypothetical protein
VHRCIMQFSVWRPPFFTRVLPCLHASRNISHTVAGGRTRNLGLAQYYALFTSSRVPSLSWRETVWDHISSFPELCRWAVLFPRQGGGTTHEAFDDKFFDWWACQIPIIEDYPYAGINFLRDPDMPMPPWRGARRDR